MPRRTRTPSPLPTVSPSPVSMSPQDYMSCREVQDLLHCSDETLYRMRYRSDGIPFIRISRSKVLYRRADVEAWLAARTTVPGSVA